MFSWAVKLDTFPQLSRTPKLQEVILKSLNFKKNFSETSMPEVWKDLTYPCTNARRAISRPMLFWLEKKKKKMAANKHQSSSSK